MISSCWVNTTRRQGVEQLEIFLGSIFLAIPPPPPLHPTLNNSPVKLVELGQNDMNQCHAIAV